MGGKNSTLIKSSVEEGIKTPIIANNNAGVEMAPAVEKVASQQGVEDFLPVSPKGKVDFAEPDSPEPERRVIKRDSNFTKSVNKSMMGKSIIQTALDAFEGGEESEGSTRRYDYTESHQKWKDVFLERDEDNSGFIDIYELQPALESVLEQEVTFEQAQSVMNDFSKQKPGLLDISEFVIMLTFVYDTVQKSNLRATTRLGGLSRQLEIAAQEADQIREEMLEEIASKVYPFREILHIQDYDANETTIDKNVSAHQDYDFNAAFAPSEMRCLALVSHNGMKATMKKFVLANKNILKKFRLTGTNSTMTMLREVFKDEADQIVFGPSCKSGPLGGDAELVALMCSGGLGGMLFFQDPMDSHPHQADIDCLVRQALVHNTIMANTPTTALTMMNVFRIALEGVGKPELIPSFFFTLESPSVAAYKAGQNKVIASHSEKTNGFSSQKKAVLENNGEDFSISRLKEDQRKVTSNFDAISTNTGNDASSSSQTSSVYGHFTLDNSTSVQKIDEIIAFFQHQKMKQQREKPYDLEPTGHTILSSDSSITSSTRDVLRDIEDKYKKYRNSDLSQDSTSSTSRRNGSARESKRRVERMRSSTSKREKIVRL